MLPYSYIMQANEKCGWTVGRNNPIGGWGMGRRLKKKRERYETHKLEPVALKKLKVGKHGDGGGLYRR
jgi:hypothetical protein